MVHQMKCLANRTLDNRGFTVGLAVMRSIFRYTRNDVPVFVDHFLTVSIHRNSTCALY